LGTVWAEATTISAAAFSAQTRLPAANAPAIATKPASPRNPYAKRQGCKLLAEGAQRAASSTDKTWASVIASGAKARGDQRVRNCGSTGWSGVRVMGMGVIRWPFCFGQT